MAKLIYSWQDLSLKSWRGEKWKEIPGLEDYFLISDYGRIKRLSYSMEYRNGAIYYKPEKIIKPQIVKTRNRFTSDTCSFLVNRVTFSGVKHNFSVARLVYHCFVQKFDLQDPGTVIFYRDGDRLNIRPGNLVRAGLNEKSSRVFQLKRAISPLRSLPAATKKKRQRALVKKRSRQVSRYRRDGSRIRTFPSMAAAERSTGISAVTVARVVSGKGISAGGSIWRRGNQQFIQIGDIKSTRRDARRKKHGQKITQYSVNGKRIAQFFSLQEAEEATGIAANAIRLVIKKKSKSAGKYFWKKGLGEKSINLTGYSWGAAASAAGHGKKVNQYTLGGKYLRTYCSLTQAAAAAGVHLSSLCGACNGRQHSSGGYQWRYR